MSCLCLAVDWIQGGKKCEQGTDLSFCPSPLVFAHNILPPPPSSHCMNRFWTLLLSMHLTTDESPPPLPLTCPPSNSSPPLRKLHHPPPLKSHNPTNKQQLKSTNYRHMDICNEKPFFSSASSLDAIDYCCNTT